ncbi:MAG: hypothetical protein JKY15_02500 [Deltaproteobacteria bacterium]|nr:hypothetical protein [Deltaproteobacteria bacterium]
MASSLFSHNNQTKSDSKTLFIFNRQIGNPPGFAVSGSLYLGFSGLGVGALAAIYHARNPGKSLTENIQESHALAGASAIMIAFTSSMLIQAFTNFGLAVQNWYNIPEGNTALTFGDL